MERLTLYSVYGEANVEFPDVELPDDLQSYLDRETGSSSRPRNAVAAASPSPVLPRMQPLLQVCPCFPLLSFPFPSPSYSHGPTATTTILASTRKTSFTATALPTTRYPIIFGSFSFFCISLHINTDLTTKTVVLKNWAISTIRGDLKPKLVKLSNYIGRTTDMKAVAQLVNLVQVIKPVCKIESGKE